MALIIAFNTTSCKEDKPDDPVKQDPLDTYQKIGEQQTTGFRVQLFMEEAPFVGYNHVAVRVMETGSSEVEKDAVVQFAPRMRMGTMTHSTPFENPVYEENRNAFMGTSTFIMSDEQAGSWTFNVIVSLPGMAADTASFDIDVVAKPEARLYSFVSQQDSVTSYFVALRNPMKPQTGMNDFELMIYKRESMMSFPPVSDLQIEMSPMMPSMGHGSPNNENPVMQGPGHYAGQFNCTMSGLWQVDLVIKDASGKVLDDQGYFNITVQ